mmetsp:Transcript_9397/g.25449  ORF Transcript_9397/g.25449 Transcript_9397/m.25449 type:complete len:270 (-) Transcript_9397:161-970(-)
MAPQTVQEEHEPSIPLVPATAVEMIERRVSTVIILPVQWGVNHPDNVPRAVAPAHGILPGEKHRACREHHLDILEEQPVVPVFQPMNNPLEISVPRLRAHHIVGDANWVGQRRREPVLPHERQFPIATHIEVDVDATIFMQNKVPNSVDTLNSVWIRQVRGKKPWVPVPNQLQSLIVRPQLVGIIRLLMRVYTRLLCPFPSLGHFLVLPRLVDELGNGQLHRPLTHLRLPGLPDPVDLLRQHPPVDVRVGYRRENPHVRVEDEQHDQKS